MRDAEKVQVDEIADLGRWLEKRKGNSRRLHVRGAKTQWSISSKVLNTTASFRISVN